MKENKTVFIKVRVTETERQQMQEFAAAHGTTMSELIRSSVYKTIAQSKEEMK